MQQRGKVAVVLLFLLLLISLSLGAGIYYLFRQEKVKVVELEKQLDNLKIKEKATLADLENFKKTVSDLESRISDKESQIDKLGNDLQEERTSKAEALAKIEQLKSDLEQQITQRQDLESKITQSQEEVQKLNAQLKDLESKKADLETRLKEMESKSIPEQKNIELGTILVSPDSNTVKSDNAAPAPEETALTASTKKKNSNSSGLEGKVLTINKEYDFVVINLGSKDGVDIGNVFSVYHAKKYLGDLKVEKLHDSMSAASFVNDPKSKDLRNKIGEGDRVVRKK